MRNNLIFEIFVVVKKKNALRTHFYSTTLSTINNKFVCWPSFKYALIYYNSILAFGSTVTQLPLADAAFSVNKYQTLSANKTN